MALTQANRFASVTSPLGEDVLLFYRMTAREHLSQLFEYELDLLSEIRDVDIKKVIGKSMTIKLQLTDDSYRYFNGLVTRFSLHGMQDGLYYFRATVHPKAWLTTRRANCRILPTNKTVPEIVKLILSEHGYTDFEIKLSGNYSPREYCVQYRETDFNFISRLMEEEGIYYYFKHTNSTHTIVLTDSISGHQKPKQYGTIPYFPPENSQRRDIDHIYEWSISHQIQSGKYVLKDFDFEKPSTDLTVIQSKPESHAEASREVYDYPGDYVNNSDGEHYVKVRMEELIAEYEQINAKGNTRALGVGHTFTFADYPRGDQNKDYLVVSAVMNIQNNEY